MATELFMERHLGATDAEGELSCISAMQGSAVISNAAEVRASDAEMINVHQ